MNKPNHKSNKGQGLVEFAMVMPVLLLMVMGIIDFGRMFYIYSAASNAVREAVRVGSTNPIDCAGIDQAARSQLTFITSSSYTVTIHYDDGAVFKPFSCPPQPGQYLTTGRDRVVVNVDATFSPLTPIISNMFPLLSLHYQAGRTISYAPGAGAPPPGSPPPPPPPPPPVVNMSCSPTSGGAPLTAVCNASADGYTVTSWNWSPPPSSGQGTASATYNLSTPGTYNVQAAASNTGGSGSADAVITVNDGPTANFTCNAHVVGVGVNLTCTDASSNGPTSGSWNWGDGATTPWTGVGSTVSHSYSTNGTRTIYLTVANTKGNSTANWVVTVYVPVHVSAVTCTPSSGNAPLAVNCTATVSGDVLAYAWDWGDNSGTTTVYPGQHTYNPATSSDFTVQLTVQGWGGSSDSATTSVAVTVPPIVAAFSCTPVSSMAPVTVTCADQSIGSPTAWGWQFGDGGTSSLQNPSHKYSAPGVYTVTLTASKQTGSNTLIKSRYITVTNLYFASYQVCASDNNNADIYVHATLTNTLKLPIASAVVTDTTTGAALEPYGNNQFCAKVAAGTGRKGDVHSSTASGIIAGTAVITSTSGTAVNNTGSCPITCP